MSNVMDWLGIDNFPEAPKIGADPVKPKVGMAKPQVDPWLQNVFAGDIGRQSVPAGGSPLGPLGTMRGIMARANLSWKFADWVTHLVQEGLTPNEIEVRMEDHPEYRARFKPMFDRRDRNQPHTSPAEILNFERTAMEMMDAANMPATMYDHYTDFQDMISAGWSPEQLGQRINEGYLRVQTSPRPVREKFTEFFGPDGDAAMAAIFINPDIALPALQKQVAAAEVAGAGLTFGFPIKRRKATEIAEAGFDYGSSMERFAGLEEMSPLMSETMGEAQGRGAQDITFDEGAAAVFGLEGAGAASRSLREREEGRQAEFAGGGGAMGSPTSGARGLGSAR